MVRLYLFLYFSFNSHYLLLRSWMNEWCYAIKLMILFFCTSWANALYSSIQWIQQIVKLTIVVFLKSFFKFQKIFYIILITPLGSSVSQPTINKRLFNIICTVLVRCIWFIHCVWHCMWIKKTVRHNFSNAIFFLISLANKTTNHTIYIAMMLSIYR